MPDDGSLADFAAAYDRAKQAARDTLRPAVVVCRTHPSTWTEAGAWWEVGVPESLSGRAGYEQHKSSQLRWVEPA